LIAFTKAHACGNDFLIVDDPVAPEQMATVARILCARNTGIGADGVEFLSLAENGAYSIRLFNADGSEAEISGNGTRCVAAVLSQMEEAESYAIHTGAGVRRCRITGCDGARFMIGTDMGTPQVAPQSVMLNNGSQIDGVAVNLGNPHFVIFTGRQPSPVAEIPWQQLGAELCVHSSFPEGTNVEFVRVTDTKSIFFHIYERGVGPTQSSGTGTCAAAAAAMEFLEMPRTLTVRSEGGEQHVSWPDRHATLMLTGPAEIIARGECFLV
jgi:diaminopimelate epimerase